MNKKSIMVVVAIIIVLASFLLTLFAFNSLSNDSNDDDDITPSSSTAVVEQHDIKQIDPESRAQMMESQFLLEEKGGENANVEWLINTANMEHGIPINADMVPPLTELICNSDMVNESSVNVMKDIIGVDIDSYDAGKIYALVMTSQCAR